MSTSPFSSVFSSASSVGSSSGASALGRDVLRFFGALVSSGDRSAFRFTPRDDFDDLRLPLLFLLEPWALACQSRRSIAVASNEAFADL